MLQLGTTARGDRNGAARGVLPHHFEVNGICIREQKQSIPFFRAAKSSSGINVSRKKIELQMPQNSS